MLKLVKRPKSPFWIARGTINGRRVEVSTGFTHNQKRQAKNELIKIQARYTATEVGEDGLTFDQAAALYVEAGGDTRFLEPIKRHFGTMLVSDIKNAVMIHAANALYPGRAASTIRRQLYTPVKAILNLAAGDELCAVPKLKTPKGGAKRTHFMLPEQADKVITAIARHPNGYLPALITFLIGQGARTGETLSLDGTDVSLEHRFATLRNTKNGEERTVALIPRVVAALSTLPTIGVRGPVFRRFDGLPYVIGDHRGGQLKKPFAAAVTEAGLDPHRITPHVCRHTWATWFYAQTKDVRRLQDEGGWKSGEWQRYTKIGTPSLGHEALLKGWNFSEMGDQWGNSEPEQMKSNG